MNSIDKTTQRNNILRKPSLIRLREDKPKILSSKDIFITKSH